MKTNTIVDGVNSVATSNLSPKTKAQELPSHRIKVKSNCGKKRFWAKQTHKKTEDGDVVTERIDLDVTTNFVIDFLPLCCDEDWEMMAYSLAKDQPNQAS